MCSELGRGKDGKFRLAGIGMFCHEFGHVLGLVDLYNTEVRATEIRKGYLWGTTSLMDNGCRNNEGRTPPNLNAIERDMLGIGNPEALAEGHYILEPIHENGRYLRFDTANEGEYFWWSVALRSAGICISAARGWLSITLTSPRRKPGIRRNMSVWRLLRNAG